MCFCWEIHKGPTLKNLSLSTQAVTCINMSLNSERSKISLFPPGEFIVICINSLFEIPRLFKARGYHPDDSSIYRCVFRSLFARRHRTKNSENGTNPDRSSIGWALLRILENDVEISNKKFQWKGLPLERTLFMSARDFPKGTPMDLVDRIRKQYLLKAMELTLPAGVEYDSQQAEILFELQLPRPPFLLTSEGKLFISDSKFYEYWVNWTIAREIADSAFWYGAFTCPVRHPLTSWMFPRNGVLPSGKICKNGLESFSCGMWNQQATYKGLNCHWTEKMSEVLRPFGGRFAGEKSIRGSVEGPWSHVTQ